MIYSAGEGPAVPYPSPIVVGGQQGTTTGVRVSLHGVTAAVRDLDVLLVGPVQAGPGAASILMSDVCSGGAISPVWAQAEVTFDDSAASSLPETCATAPDSGGYRPTNYDTDDSFLVAPGPFPVGLGAFRGIDPNGEWHLYVLDDSPPDPVTIARGWTLEITTTGAGPPQPSGQKKPKCKKKQHGKKKRKRCKKKKKKKKKKRHRG